MIQIPEDVLCERGCGRNATVFALGRHVKGQKSIGKFLCSRIPAKCPIISRKCKLKNLTPEAFSKKVKEGRNKLDSLGKSPAQHGADRMKEIDPLTGRTKSQLAAAKGVNSRTKSGPASKVEGRREEYKTYKILVQKISRWSYQKYSDEINPNQLQIGRRKHHIDHIFSIIDGFVSDIPAYILGNPTNLRAIHYSENCSKNHRSDITEEELRLRFSSHPMSDELCLLKEEP